MHLLLLKILLRLFFFFFSYGSFFSSSFFFLPVRQMRDVAIEWLAACLAGCLGFRRAYPSAMHRAAPVIVFSRPSLSRLREVG